MLKSGTQELDFSSLEHDVKWAAFPIKRFLGKIAYKKRQLLRKSPKIKLFQTGPLYHHKKSFLL
jgi:hypothetical protein